MRAIESNLKVYKFWQINHNFKVITILPKKPKLIIFIIMNSIYKNKLNKSKDSKAIICSGKC